MRHDCTVVVNSPTASWRIGVRPTSGGTWRWFPANPAGIVSQTLWNFKPGTTYAYQVQTDTFDSATGRAPHRPAQPRAALAPFPGPAATACSRCARASA
jgi:hypothetical protein